MNKFTTSKKRELERAKHQKIIILRMENHRHSTKSAASIFDITHDQEPTLENYCIALLEKVFTIPQSQLPEFINYQLQIAQDGNTWLNKFEKLLANNEELFINQKTLRRFNKLYNIIEKKRTELQASSVKEIKQPTPKRLINADAEDRYFSFFEVKQYVELGCIFFSDIKTLSFLLTRKS